MSCRKPVKKFNGSNFPFVSLHWIVCLDIYVLSRLHDISWLHFINFNMNNLIVTIWSTVHNSFDHGLEPTVVPHKSISGGYEKPRIMLQFNFWKLSRTFKKLFSWHSTFRPPLSKFKIEECDHPNCSLWILCRTSRQRFLNFSFILQFDSFETS